MARILVACEYSGRVRDAFRALGHDAISCDLLPTDNPGPHYQGDCFDLDWSEFDLVIAHPPCTYLTIAAEWAYKDDPGKVMKAGSLFGAERRAARDEALAFIERMWHQPVPRLCIENPVGVINKRLPFMPAPQYVQPWWFGDDASKKTGLWVRGLPRLTAFVNNAVTGRWVCCGQTIPEHLGKHGCPNCCGDNQPVMRWANQTDSGQNKLPPSADRWKQRSVTYPGIAAAMAEQWGALL